mgnify:CR=1 FL=1
MFCTYALYHHAQKDLFELGVHEHFQIAANFCEYYNSTVRLETGVTTYTLSSFLTSRHSKIVLVLLCINLYCVKFYIQTFYNSLLYPRMPLPTLVIPR